MLLFFSLGALGVLGGKKSCGMVANIPFDAIALDAYPSLAQDRCIIRQHAHPAPVDSMTRTIRIGTRSSRLSLWQTNYIAGLIRAHHGDVAIELKTYQTRGDQQLDLPLPSIGGKGLFTLELESAMQRGEIDCAVHSLKDLPTEESAEIVIAAIPQRGDHRDALVSRDGLTLEQLPPGSCVGSSSLRRQAQLLRLRPDLELVDIRGNVPTRIQKLMSDDSAYDAIVLAVAGLERLGLAQHISASFDIDRMTSAAGQGALAVQCPRDSDLPALLMPLNHRPTEHATEAERAFLGALAGGCSTPVGAYAHVVAGTLRLQARVVATDGTQQIDVSGETKAFDGPKGKDLARQLGERLAEQSLKQGARLLLQNSSSDTDDR